MIQLLIFISLFLPVAAQGIEWWHITLMACGIGTLALLITVVIVIFFYCRQPKDDEYSIDEDKDEESSIDYTPSPKPKILKKKEKKKEIKKESSKLVEKEVTKKNTIVQPQPAPLVDEKPEPPIECDFQRPQLTIQSTPTQANLPTQVMDVTQADIPTPPMDELKKWRQNRLSQVDKGKTELVYSGFFQVSHNDDTLKEVPSLQKELTPRKSHSLQESIKP